MTILAAFDYSGIPIKLSWNYLKDTLTTDLPCPISEEDLQSFRKLLSFLLEDSNYFELQGVLCLDKGQVVEELLDYSLNDLLTTGTLKVQSLKIQKHKDSSLRGLIREELYPIFSGKARVEVADFATVMTEVDSFCSLDNTFEAYKAAESLARKEGFKGLQIVEMIAPAYLSVDTFLQLYEIYKRKG